jgi:hypothetical protein
MATSAGILQISERGTFQYLPGRYPWSDKEEQQLQEALAEFPVGSFSGAERYIMVASKIPTKTVRDVRACTWAVAAARRRPRFSAPRTGRALIVWRSCWPACPPSCAPRPFSTLPCLHRCS